MCLTACINEQLHFVSLSAGNFSQLAGHQFVWHGTLSCWDVRSRDTNCVNCVVPAGMPSAAVLHCLCRALLLMHSLCSLCSVHANPSNLSRFSALRAGVAVLQVSRHTMVLQHHRLGLLPMLPSAKSKDAILVPTVLSATALSMVEPSQRWLLNPAPLLQSLRAPQPFITPVRSPNPSRDPSTTALSRCRPGIAHSIVVLTGDSRQALGNKCQYTDLTREHAAAHAHALLARLQSDAEQKPTVPDDVFHQALALGKHSCCLL